MKAICIVGGTGSGKSTYIKEQLLPKVRNRALIYDVNNEYGTGVKLLSMKDFNAKAKAAVNTFIVYEEATIFFNNRGLDNELVDILVRKRHTKNTIVFVFHSLRAIPTYIIDMIDFFVIFRTNDLTHQVYKRFRDNYEIMNAYKYVNALPPFKYGENIYNHCAILSKIN